MRILYVAMAASIHVARFISQVNHLGWDLHLFNSSVESDACHPLLQNATLHGCWNWQRPAVHASVTVKGFWPFDRGIGAANFFACRYLSPSDIRSRKVARLIDRLRPDIIHSHEIQHSGYLVMDALKYLKRDRPPWIVTNWGSDICFFGQLAAHASKIRAVLENCDYYSCETERDRNLAASFGFRGEFLSPVLPNPGGFRFEDINPLWQPGPTSQRRLVLVKGYQGLFGRAITALYALELCQELLRNYRIVLYSARPAEVPIAAEILANRTGLHIEIMPHTNDYHEILRLRGQARVSIGLSVSDAASISFLESLALGSFPIQSNTGGAHEWIRDGEGGFLVHPDDPHLLAAALRRALTEDDLVDRAAENNYRLARERLDFYRIRSHVIRWYEQIMQRKNTQSAHARPMVKSEGDRFRVDAA